jgi:hypothetical protein
VIKLKSSLLWDGHLISAGKIVALPELLEKSIVSAGNGEYVNLTEETGSEKPETQEIPASEKVDTDGTEQENSPPEGQTAADPELQLGRVGRTQ